MKNILLIIITLISVNTYSQNINIDVGKHEKKIEIKTKNNISYLNGNIFKKEIQGTRLVKKDENYDYLKTHNENIKIHLSTTFQNDTTSVSYKNEYLNIRPIKFPEKPITYLHEKYVTNRDWNEFKSYVVDSIARRILSSEFPETFLIKTYNNKGEEKDESEWRLNWGERLTWIAHSENDRNAEQVIVLKPLFFPDRELFYHKKEIDPRRLFFQYTNPNGVFENVNIYRDSTLWVSEIDYNKTHNVEDMLSSTYNSHSYFDENPVTGINAEQAKGYLSWKQKFHQKELDKNKIPLKVIYRLPSLEEISNLTTDENTVNTSAFDLTEWKITNKDYSQFVKYVVDSIAYRILGQEDPDYFLNPTYDNELEMNDESEWLLNKTKTNLKDYPKYISLLKEYNFDYYNPNPKSLTYSHYFYDFKTASIVGEFVAETDEGSECEKLTYYSSKNLDKNGRPVCKDLLLGYTNWECLNNDVRSHADRSKFIIKEHINVYPGIKFRNNKIIDNYDSESGETNPFEDNLSENIEKYNFNKNPDKLITNITYGQFVAYWLWKRRIKKQDSKSTPNSLANPIAMFYIPSEEEFKIIQSGKEIKHPEENFNLPTPTFRYCINFYPKKTD